MLRNAILFALALDATDAEIQSAHDAIDNFFNVEPGSVAPVTLTAAAPTTNTGIVINTSNLDLDKEGLPWDERIHSSNKKKTATGVWTARRNVDEGTRAAVKAALLASLGGAGNGVTALPTTPVVGTVPLPGANVPALPVGLPTPPTIDPTYKELTDLVAANADKGVTPEWLGQVLQAYGVADGSLQTAAHNIPACVNTIAFIKSTLKLP